MSRAEPAVQLPPLELLACPRCKGALEQADGALTCGACGRTYPAVEGAVDFTLSSTDGGWSGRQRTMLEWYDELSTDAERTERCFRADYGVIAPLLAGLSGTVLDVGGGAGVTRRYLPASVRYVNVDPSASWLGTRWTEQASPSAPLAAPMAFAQATGEALPFAPRPSTPRCRCGASITPRRRGE